MEQAEGVTSAATILIVPGLRDHVADHWQTLLARKLATVRPVCAVPPMGREDLSCAKRVAAIQDALASIRGEVIIVAHSGGTITVAHWARQHRRAGILGALLAAPADLDTPLPAGYPDWQDLQDGGWLPVPREKLPFRSVVAVSSNDPLGALWRIEDLAGNWGSQCVRLGPVGHLNPASGFGEWPQAEELIAQLERG